ncbi:MAG: SDR family oxidoreductase [Deltaproteobacteria bacterium]|nr:SDR family oxidoreductase [Deltaproteobacteria bacterium]
MQLLILGANSDIALALAAKFAQGRKANLYLASRDMDRLTPRARDLELRFQVKAEPVFFDALDYASHSGFFEGLNPKPDGVILAFGYLGNQSKAQADFEEARKIIETNFLGAVSILEVVAADFEERGQGFIMGLSSVAGDRGRAANYVYGSAKGALKVFLSGLRNRLDRKGVKVTTVLPGQVLTKMTRDLDLDIKRLAQPDQVAGDIYKAYLKSKDIIYTPPLWRLIMAVIKAIPERVFKRLDL